MAAPDKRRGILEEAVIFVSVDVERINGLVNGQAGRQKVANLFLQVNHVLGCNVIYEKHALLQIEPNSCQGLQKCKINILLLFTFEQVDQGIRHKASMPCTGNADDTSKITCL
jgi:hypothetical protein